MSQKNKLLTILGFVSIASLVFFFIIMRLYVFGAIFLGFCVIFATIATLKERYETRCSKCKTPYNYDTDVEYKELKRWTTGPDSTSSTINGTFAQVFYRIEFKCHCSNCNTTKRYIKKIGGPKITSNGDYVDEDVEGKIEQSFTKSELTAGQTTIYSICMIIFSAVCIFGGIFLRILFS